MRAAFIIAIAMCLVGCTKTTLPPFTNVTRVEVQSFRTDRQRIGTITAPEKLAVLLQFMNRPRARWTRTFVFDFGVPKALVRADLYEGERYVGYFAVGGGRLPGKRAFFEVRRGNVLTRLTVPISEANEFIDLIDARGERIINLSI